MHDLLFVTQVAPYADGPAGVHGVLDQSAVAVGQVAELNGLRARRVVDVRDLEPADLAGARALALFTIGETPWSPAQRGAILDRVRAGSLALVAVHSATDACYGWPEYGSLVGARFDGHPWTQTVDVEVVDRGHPATGHLDAAWRWHDEVYQFRDLRPDAHVLLRVPERELDLGAPGAKHPTFGFPRLVVLRRRRGPGVLHQPRPLPGGLGDAELPPAPRGRARVGARRETVSRDRNFSPWAQWQLRLAATEPGDPMPGRRRPRGAGRVAGPVPGAPRGAARAVARAGATRPRGARVRRLRLVPPRPDRVRHRGRDVGPRVPPRSPRPRRAGAGRARPARAWSRQVGGVRSRRRREPRRDRGAQRRLRAPARATGLRRARTRPPVLRRARRLGAAREVPLRPQPRPRLRRRRVPAHPEPLGPRPRARRPVRSRAGRPRPHRHGGPLLRRDLHPLPRRDRRARPRLRGERVLLVVEGRAPRALEPLRLAGAARHARGARARRPRRARRAAADARGERLRRRAVPGRGRARRASRSSAGCTPRSTRRPTRSSTTRSRATTGGTAWWPTTSSIAGSGRRVPSRRPGSVRRHELRRPPHRTGDHPPRPVPAARAARCRGDPRRRRPHLGPAPTRPRRPTRRIRARSGSSWGSRRVRKQPGGAR